MSAINKLELLRVISRDAEVDQAMQFSFHSFSRSLPFPATLVDKLLNELEEERFIKYILSDVEGFVVAVTQKGLDAVRDESFI
ncbi:MAG: hypothetical protein ABUT20_07160 [Bacteroidota bacterium]